MPRGGALGCYQVEQRHSGHHHESDGDIILVGIILAQSRAQSSDVDAVSCETAPQTCLFVRRKCQDTARDLPSSVCANKRFLALHPKRPSDAMWRKQLGCAQGKAEPAKSLRQPVRATQ